MSDWSEIEEMTLTRKHGSPNEVARGHRAVASTDNAIVTETALRTIRNGGNAADAAVAACLVQSIVDQHMTNHTGLITCLYWDAATRKAYQLESVGYLPGRLPVFRPVPPVGGLAPPGMTPPAACIPGQIPGLAALNERFGSKPWSELCEDAVYWAENGHLVTDVEAALLVFSQPFINFFPEGRQRFMPQGRMPVAGERFHSPDLEHTIKRLAEEGPAYFTEGEWAEKFVAAGNELGWAITLEDMTAVEPRWIEPQRWQHRGVEVIQQAPPEIQAALCAMVLGILDHLGTPDKGHFTQSAEAFYDMAHALRWVGRDLGFLNDPEYFRVPMDVYLDDEYHRRIARIIDGSRPRVDLTNHVNLTSGPLLRRAGRSPEAMLPAKSPLGSCENVFVDAQGNWCQLMNTLQSGGIPGMVVGGVSMVGSHALIGSLEPTMGFAFGGFLADGARLRMPLANTFIMGDGEPSMSLGTTGNVCFTPPQVLSNILDHGMDPYAAIDLPRMMPMMDDLSVMCEGGIGDEVVDGLAALGVRLMQQGRREIMTGSFSIAYRDEETGLLNACADPRLNGLAAGID